MLASAAYLTAVLCHAVLDVPLLHRGCLYLLCRQVAVWAVFWLLVLFYAPIVAAIQAPVNMDNLRKVMLLSLLSPRKSSWVMSG